MKHLFILIFFISYSLYGFSDPLTFKPLVGNCKSAFNTCFSQCKKIEPAGPLCKEKKRCLNQCNAKMINSLQPQWCFEKCAKIDCPSTERCTQRCFKKTKPGKCRANCRNLTPRCLQECDKKDIKEESGCARCCDSAVQNCESTCCSLK